MHQNLKELFALFRNLIELLEIEITIDEFIYLLHEYILIFFRIKPNFFLTTYLIKLKL